MIHAAYYNEPDPYAAQWLRNLIAADLIAPGDVDERDIRDVKPEELEKYTQCHFFAGIGIHSAALRAAGWDDSWPIWTGSCPCQPFSKAGRGEGEADERHLWPHWHWLIQQRRPAIVSGEQVAGRDGLAWLDLVSSDFEHSAFAIGASDLCAAGFGGAHIRNRLYFSAMAEEFLSRLIAGGDGWMADLHHARSGGRRYDRSREGADQGKGSSCERTSGLRPTGGMADQQGRRCGKRGDEAQPGPGGYADSSSDPSGGGLDDSIGIGCGSGRDRDHAGNERQQSWPAIEDGGLDNCQREGLEGHAGDGDAAQRWQRAQSAGSATPPGDAGRIQYPDGRDAEIGEEQSSREQRLSAQDRSDDGAGDSWIGHNGGPGMGADASDMGWGAVDWLRCRDGLWRPVEAGTFPLADAHTARVGRLRAYGNALDFETARQFYIALIGTMQQIMREGIDSAPPPLARQMGLFD